MGVVGGVYGWGLWGSDSTVFGPLLGNRDQDRQRQQDKRAAPLSWRLSGTDLDLESVF